MSVGGSNPFHRGGDDLYTETTAVGGSPGSGSDASIDLEQGVYGREIISELPIRSDADSLRYEHPEYQAQVLKWRKYLDTYEGNEVWRFIHRHLRESDEMYQRRVKRSYYYNYVASVVDLYIAYIYHAPITRQLEDQEEFYRDLHENADLQGTNFSVFIQEAATQAQICGYCGILVDMPTVPPELIETEADRKAHRLRPYLTLVDPLQLLDWEVDRWGNFLWVKIEVFPPQDRTWKETIDEEVRHFLIWTRTGWERWELRGEDARIINSGEHSLGVVPLVILLNERRPKHLWMGLSAIRDIADINIGILNWSSMGDEEIFERCLNVLTMEKDDSEAAAEISHHNVLEYASGATPPQYLVPGDSPLQMIGQWIDRAKDEIYRLAKFGGSVGLMGTRQATSGIAYAFEFNETNQALAKKATHIEHAETEIHQLYARWLDTIFRGTVSYPREFGVEDFLMDLQVLTEARMTMSSEEAIREIERKLVTKMFARDGGQLRETIISEINRAPAKPPVPAPLQLPGGLKDRTAGRKTLPGNQYTQPQPVREAGTQGT
jgi:hypothetical protein